MVTKLCRGKAIVNHGESRTELKGFCILVQKSEYYSSNVLLSNNIYILKKKNTFSGIYVDGFGVPSFQFISMVDGVYCVSSGASSFVCCIDLLIQQINMLFL